MTAAQTTAYRALLVLQEIPVVLQGCDRLGLSVEQLDASLRDQNAEFFEMAALAYWGD
ncbi:hypothetical protein [Pacificibacter sp. AS14]|uniref:hypothetical protein n=1 Tax=Pacificibacter sp. AS14 TaxID=3135785 RepID=UPI0031751B9D